MHKRVSSAYFFLGLLLVVAWANPIQAQEFLAVCDRTQQVQDVILDELGHSDCTLANKTELATITIIDLSSQGLISLQSGDFSGMNALTEITLLDNSLTQLPSGIFYNLTNLITLDLQLNEISSLDADIFDWMWNLETLFLAQNKLTQLPENGFDYGLWNLEILSFADNQLTHLPDAYLPEGLRELYLQNNNLTTIPLKAFEYLIEIRILELSNNQITHLPDEIFYAIEDYSSTIKLDGNNLTNIDNVIFPYEMEVLWLQNNQLTSISETLFDDGEYIYISDVVDLRLGNNLLTSIPDNLLSPFYGLRNLDLSNNKLTSIGETFLSGQSSLQTVSFANNSINSLESATFNGLSSLNTLELQGNNLTSLDANLLSGSTTSLATLRLDDNKINAVPSGFLVGVGFLQNIRLDNNNLTALPQGIFDGLIYLESLELQNNNNLIAIDLNTTINAQVSPTVNSLQFGFDVLQGAAFDTVYELSSDNGSFQVDGSDVSTVTVDKGTSSSDTISFIFDEDKQAASISIQPQAGYAFADSLVLLNTSLTVDQFGFNASITGLEVVLESSVNISLPVFIGADSDITYSLVGLPASLSFNTSTLVINGTPSTEEILDLSYQATDTANNIWQLNFTLTVYDGFLPVCSRTHAVRDALVLAANVAQCEDVGEANVAAINSLSLVDVDLSSFKQADLTGLTSLVTLDIINNELKELPAGLFDELLSIRFLQIYGTKISSLPAGLFNNINSLDTLYLNGNALEQLPAGIFSNLSNIFQLSLSDNNLSSLPLGIFDELFLLDVLYLGRNQLTSLDESLFSGVSSVTLLSLSGNNLTQLPSGLFDELIYLDGLYLYNNQLSSLDADLFNNLSVLTKLFLYGNELTALPMGIFDSMPLLLTLHLNENQLSSLDIELFDELTYLQTLLLNDNQISDLVLGLFDNNAALKELHLQDNDLTDLKDQIFNNLVNLNLLHLQDNDLSALPAGIFSGLSSLNNTDFSNNVNVLPIVINLNATSEQISREGELDFTLDIVQGAPSNLTYLLSSDTGSFSLNDINITSFSVPAGNTASDSLTFTLDEGQTLATLSINSDQTIPGLALLNVTENFEKDTTPGFTSSVENQMVTAGEFFNLTLPEAIAGNGNLTYTLTNAGNDFSYNQSAGSLSGTASSVQTYNVSFQVTDIDGDTDQLNFNITVNADLQPIIASLVANQSLIAGQLLNLSIPSASSGNGNLTYSLTGAGDDFVYNQSNSSLSGTANTVGIFMASYQVSDEDKDITEVNFTITVVADLQPVINSLIFNQSIIAGELLNLTIPLATSGNGNLTYTLTGTGDDFDYNQSASLLSGTANNVGTVNATYQVSDIDGDVTQVNFTITVVADLQPSIASQIASQSVIAGEQLNISIPLASSGNGNLTYTLTGQGNDFDYNQSASILEGTAASVGIFNATYQVSDIDGDIAQVNFTITVIADLQPSITSPIANQTVIAGELLNLTIPLATSGNGNLTYTLNGQGNDFDYNQSASILKGAATSVGIFNTTYQVSDIDGDITQANFTITVVADLQPTIASQIANQTIIAGELLNISVPLASSGNGNLSYTLTGQGTDFDYNQSASILQGTADNIGTFNATYQVSDIDGDISQVNFTITVVADLQPTIASQIANQTIIAGELLNISVPLASSGNGNLTYTFSGQGSDFTYNQSASTLKGTADLIGIFNATYQVSDIDGDISQVNFTITVETDLQPTIASQIANQTIIAGELLNLTIPLATSGNGNLIYTLTGQGTDFDYNQSASILKGTADNVGSFNATYQVSDFDGDITQVNFTITVVADLQPSIASQIANQTVIAGEQLNVSVPLASSGNGNLTYTLTGQGIDFDYNQSASILKGTANSVGTFNATYQVSDIDGDITQVNFTITVVADLQPTIASQIASQIVIAGEQLNVSVPLASSGNGNLTYTFSGQGSDFVYNQSASILKGTANSVGIFNTTYQVSDIDGDISQVNFTITVNADLQPTIASQIANQTVIAGEQLNISVPLASSGNGNLSYSLTGQGTDFAYNQSASILQGTASSVGIFKATYQVSDIDDDITQVNFTITVVADLQPSILLPIANQSVTVNELLNLSLPLASSGNGNLSYTITGFSNDFAYNQSASSLSGIAVLVGVFNATYQVSDTDGDIAQQNFTITVISDGSPYFLGEVDDQTVIEGELLNISIPSATDGNGILSYSFSSNSTDFSFNETSNRLVGIATLPGLYNASYEVSDEDNDITVLKFAINVQADLQPVIDASIANQTVIAGELLNISIPAASGGNDNLTYSFSGQGADFNYDQASSILNGIANQEGTFNATYQVSDIDGDITQVNFTITVLADLQPVISSLIADQSVIENELLSISIPSASGGNGNLTYSITGISSDFDYHQSASILNGTASQAGSFQATYQVSDEDGDITQVNFTITVIADLQPVIATNINDFTITAGELLNISIPAASGGNGNLSFSLIGQGDDFSYNQSARTLLGTANQVGIFNATYQVSDIDGDSTQENFSITVIADLQPSISSMVANQTITMGELLTISVPSASGGNGNLSYSIIGQGSDFDYNQSTSTLSGVANQVGTFNATYSVNDEDGDTALISFSITVVSDLAPAFTSFVTDQIVTVGELLNTSLPISEAANGNLTYSIDGHSGDFDYNQSASTLSGIASLVGSFNITYQVSDEDGDTVQLNFSLTVISDGSPYFLAAVTDQSVIAGELLNISIPTATDGNGNLSYSFSLDNTDFSFNETSSRLIGIANQIGIFNATYVVSDEDSDTTTLTFSISVLADLQPVIASQIANQSVIAGELLNISIPLASSGNGNLTYSLTGQGNDFDFDQSSSELSGIASSVGSFNATYQVSDEDGDITQLNFSINVISDLAPVFASSIANQSVIAGELLNVSIPAAYSGNGNLSYSLTGQGDDFAFNQSSNELSGIANSVGVFNTLLQVQDQDGDISALNFSITVLSDLQPTIDLAIANITVIAGEIVNISIPSASGGNGNLTYSLEGASSDLVYNQTISRLSGIASQVGIFNATYQVSDEDGDVTQANFSITVQADSIPLLDDSIANLTLNQGDYLSLALPQATGGNDELTYNLTGQGNDFEFNLSSLLLQGTANEIGTLNLSYQVQDIDGDLGTLNFSIVVLAKLLPSFSQAVANQTIVHNELFNITLPQATGGLGALEYSLQIDGEDFSFNASNRQLSGIAANIGAFNVTYLVQDSEQANDTVSFVITVEPDSLVVFDLGYEDLTLTARRSIATAIALPSFTGGNAPYSYSLESPTITGLVTNLTSLTFAGTPNGAPGVHEITFVVTDSNGNATSLVFNINLDENLAPVFALNATTSYIIEVGSAVSLALPNASSKDTPLTHSLAILNQPAFAGLSYDAAANTLTGIAQVTGEASVNLTATDSDNDTAILALDFSFQTAKVPAFNGTVAKVLADFNEDLVNIQLPIDTNSANGQLVVTINTQVNGSAIANLPSGLSLNVSDEMVYAITGYPDALGLYNISITLSDTDQVELASDQSTTSFELSVVEPFAFASPLDSLYSFTVNKTITAIVLPKGQGGREDYVSNLIVTNGSLPAGLSFDTDSNTIAGNATVTGNVSYQYSLTDADARIISTIFTLSIQNPIPSIETMDIINVVADDKGSISLPLPQDADLYDYSYEVVTAENPEQELPSGFSFDALTATLSYDQPDSGTYNLQYIVKRPGGQQVFYDFLLVIEENSLPEFAHSSLSYIIEQGSNLELALLNASGTNGPLSYNFQADDQSVFSAVVYDQASNQLNGTLSLIGLHSAALSVTDSDLDAANLSLVFNVQAASAPAFTASVDSVIADISEEVLSIALPIDTDSGNGDLIITSKGLPEGFSYNASSSSISGVPAAAGVFNVTVTLSDSDNVANSSDESQLSFQINIAQGLSFASSLPASSYVFDVLKAIDPIILPAGQGGRGDLTYSLQAISGQLPANLSYDNETLTISGVPEVSGSVLFNYSISDEDARSISTLFNLSVQLPAPVISAPADMTLQRGEDFAILLPKPADENLYAYTYSLELKDTNGQLPEGISFDEIIAQLSGSFEMGGTYTFVYRVVNAENISVSYEFDINVRSQLFAALSRDLLTRQALIVSDHISSTVKDRMKLLGKGRAAYQRNGDKEAINIDLSSADASNGKLLLSVWTSSQSTDAKASLNVEGETLSWNGATDSSQVGFDVGYENTLVGLVSTSTSADLALSGEGNYKLNLQITSPYVGYREKDFEVWATLGSGSGDAKATVNDVDYSSDSSFSMLYVGGKYHIRQGKTKLAVAFEQTFASISIAGSQTYDASKNFAAQSVVSLDASRNFKLPVGQFTPSFSFALRNDNLEGSDTDGYLARHDQGLELGLSVAYDYDWLSASLGTKTYSVSSGEDSYEETNLWYHLSVSKANKLGLGYTFGSSLSEESDRRGQLLGTTDLSNLYLSDSAQGDINFEQQFSYGWQLRRGVFSVFTSYRWDDDAFSLSNFEHKQSTWKEFGANLNSSNGAYRLSLSFNPVAERTLIKGKIAIK